jgi:secreted Zn-dependent insulinase-like peptidase
MSVGIGSLHDPKQAMGMSHFIEHMCFMGSHKFPKETEFNDFVDANGGYSNAYTEDLLTNYSFSIDSEKLDHSVHMFSRFFIDPLIKQDAVARELKAIDSEF